MRKTSRMFGCGKQPPTQLPGGSPAPLYRQRKKLRCPVGHGAKSRRAAPVRSCARRLGAGRVYQQTGMKPLGSPCRRRLRAKDRSPENSVFSIFEANSDSWKNIFSPLVPDVLLEPGAFDFSTRIKGGGRKAPASRSQRPAERGVSRDCGISPQRRARWSLQPFFEF